MKAFAFYFHCKPHPFLYKLIEPQSLYIQVSHSCILSLSLFLVRTFRFLRPPHLLHHPQAQQKEKLQEMEEVNQKVYYAYEQGWNSYLTDLVMKNHALVHDEVFYMEIPLEADLIDRFSPQQKALLHKIEIKVEDNLSGRQQLIQVFNLKGFEEKQTKKIAILNIRREGDVFAPKIHMPALLIGILFNNHHWSVLNVLEESIPSVEQFQAYDCLILPGSTSSVLTLPQHLQQATINIFEAFQINKKLKILGICFGHQIVSQFFKGKVEKLGRAGGIQEIQFNENVLKQYNFFSKIQNIKSLCISVHHQDFVTSIPEGFKLFASSKSCNIEGLVSKDGRILTVQFHSEYFCRFTELYEKKQLFYHKKNNLANFYIPDTPSKEAINLIHSSLMLKVYQDFISYQ